MGEYKGLQFDLYLCLHDLKINKKHIFSIDNHCTKLVSTMQNKHEILATDNIAV